MDRAFVYSQAKFAAAQVSQVLHALLDFVAEVEQALGVIAQQFAGVGEFYLAGAADQQRLAYRFLEASS